MEQLGLVWVLLAGTLAGTLAASRTREQDLGPIKKVAMDMAQNSFDDQYWGCRYKMEEKLKEVNRTEFQNKTYADTWGRAVKKWQSLWGNSNQPQVLRQEQAVAVLAYTAREGLYKQFNAAVRKGGRSCKYYLQSFPFKTLHFLLTQALRTLRDAQGHRCYHVYRGIKGIRFTAHLQQTVRFGQFTSTSLKKKVAQSFGQDTFFFVYTCYGVPIKPFSFYPAENEVLIPPFEVFKVTNVTRYTNGNVIHLRSHAACSTYNCALLKGKGSQQGGCHREMAGAGAQPWAGAALPALLQPWPQESGGPRATGSVRGRGALW
ncbi:NAD(P)(+)--arginine ADP-ribosyltransferase 2 [Anser cygnoides]|uniref:NAD(P)(+)--arginine ADP-ribosyltransferase 2 n=1 Tax=Anser cygnoides TaxID=8845 RepID=UPI0034D2633B